MHRSFVSVLIQVLCALLAVGAWAAGAAEATADPVPPMLLTNLLQLRAAAGQPPILHSLRIIAEVIDVDATNSAVALRDVTGVEFLQLEVKNPDITPGATICLEGVGCAVKFNRFGLSIVPSLVTDNDGIHPMFDEPGRVFLHAGRNPIAVQWFNYYGVFGLQAEYEGPGLPRQPIPGTVLSRAKLDPRTGRTNFCAGLNYRCYEGVWDSLPDFDKCRPIKTGVATNFDLNVRTRDLSVGLEFKGFITVPAEGIYTFHLSSDDGSRLFAGDSSLTMRVLSQESAPRAADHIPEANAERDHPLVNLEGAITYASIWNTGGELQLQAGNDSIRVEVFAGSDFAPPIEPHHKVRVCGIYEDVVREDGSWIPGRLLVLNWHAVHPAEAATPLPAKIAASETLGSSTAGSTSAPAVSAVVSTAAEIKALCPADARQELPVSIRGVVTAFLSKYSGAVVQDATKGIFVELNNSPGAESMQWGEYCQIYGVTGPGLFAPVVSARRVTHLGPGQLPPPTQATWDQLVNGSLDTEYAEINGVVTSVHDRQVVMLIPGGKIALDLNDTRPESLAGYENAVVRIRGCVFANFNLETHKLGAGSLTVRSAAIDILQAAPRNLFDAPRKSIGELLLYDPKAAPFRLLKVSGQVIYGRPGEYYLTDGTNGIHATTISPDAFAVGDLVEAVGFLELGGPAAELKEAVLRRTGRAPLGPPARLAPDQLLQASNADMSVQVAATLMNQWREGAESLLQLQSGFLAFKARVNNGGSAVRLPPLGSRLELTGVYAPQGIRTGDGSVSGFELLLPSAANIQVLATPPWWTLKRMLALAGILAVLLLAVLIWNKELQWKVQERSRQLEAEIRQRQQAELRQAAEAERARIARDLHDELGAGLTEVSLLASTGLRKSNGAEQDGGRLQVIAEKARALVSGLDVIVWAIDPKRNSLQSFADYLGRYVSELFASSDIRCRFKIPVECDLVTLTETERHSLFLAVKEALNNVIRHASATEVELQIAQFSDHLEIVIADNGRGFDGNPSQDGNGLGNLYERLAALNGRCQIDSQPGKGTSVKFIIPVPRQAGEALQEPPTVL
ncbi:MAG TPA: ATP-binding protein [Verrucomicrobiae bacterium]